MLPFVDPDQTIILHTEEVIDSAHQLKGYDGKCSHCHGHTWKVEIWIKGKYKQLNNVGILFDFGNIKQIKELFDHKFINNIEIEGHKIFEHENPTCENLAATIYYLLTQIDNRLEYKVKVYETAIGKKTYGVLNPNNI